jgi:DNA repair protein RecO (recombination protein O)|tara:strand:- start:3419 stop:4141 length:723 start_codon:yes stop_codon:yes gene_type:complete
MRWESNGLILNFSKYNEKSYILEIFTEEHGKHKGIIRGLHSKNKRSIIEPGNEVFATWSGRLETHLGNYNVEPIKLWSSHVLQFKDKLSAISSICSLISLTMAERQPNPIIYFSSKKLIEIVASKREDWIREYVFWEMQLLSEIGYGLDLERCAVTSKSSDLVYVSPSSGRAVTNEGAGDFRNKLLPLPKFMTDFKANYDNDDIYNALNLTEFFFKKRFFLPNNLNFPQSRNRLKELFNH